MRNLKDVEKEISELERVGKESLRTLTEVAGNRRNDPLARAIAASVLMLAGETRAENLRKELNHLRTYQPPPRGREATRR